MDSGYSLYRRLFGPVEADLAGVRRLISICPPNWRRFRQRPRHRPADADVLVDGQHTDAALAGAQMGDLRCGSPHAHPAGAGSQAKTQASQTSCCRRPIAPRDRHYDKFPSRAILRHGARSALSSSEKCSSLYRAQARKFRASPREPALTMSRRSRRRLHGRRAAQGDIARHPSPAGDACGGRVQRAVLPRDDADRCRRRRRALRRQYPRLPLNTDLTVLSACRTAAANATSSFGEITTSLLMAGSKRVVTTCWPIAWRARPR